MDEVQRSSIGMNSIPYYLCFSPEAMVDRGYSEKSDVWAFGNALQSLSHRVFLFQILIVSTSPGIVMGEVLLRSLPYPELTVLQVASVVAPKTSKWLLPIDKNIQPAALVDIQRSCLEWEPALRPSFQRITEMLKECDGGG